MYTWTPSRQRHKGNSGEKTAFQQMVLEQIDTHMQKKKKKNLDAYLIPYTKINSTWITDISIKPKTTQCLKRNKRNFCDLVLNQRFLRYDTKSVTQKRAN